MKSVFVTLAVFAVAAALSAQTPAPGPELKVGDQAPDFRSQGTDGKTYKLSDCKGKQAVVVAWFPKAYTSGCTDRVQVARGERRHDPEVQRAYFMASVDPLERATRGSPNSRRPTSRC